MNITETKEAQERQEFNNTLIVDGLNLAFRYKHNKTRNFGSEYVKLIQSLANSYACDKIIVLADGGSTYRREIYPDYKSARKEMVQNQTEEEKEEFQRFLNDFHEALDLAKNVATVIKFDGVEADDIAAYITVCFKHRKELGHIWLVSSDKDWDLLVQDNVSRFSYRTRRETTVDNWRQEYGYEPQDHISVKVLTGDKSDSIPGVPGIGEKRAASLIRQYGDAFDIYDQLPIDSKYKYIKSLNEFGDDILRNYKLMDLITYCGEALGDENCKTVDKIMEEEVIYGQDSE